MPLSPVLHPIPRGCGLVQCPKLSGGRRNHHPPVSVPTMDALPLSRPSAAAPGSAADRTSSRKTLAPFSGIARGVQYAVDGDRVLCIPVEHRIRKAALKPAGIALVDDGMHLGRTADGFK